MTKKPLAFENNIRVSKHFSGAGEAPRRRLSFQFKAAIWLEAHACLHNTVSGLSLVDLRNWVAEKLASIAQTFWKRVGDSSYDPVLVLQQQTAIRGRISVIPKGLIACKASARSLVMVDAWKQYCT